MNTVYYCAATVVQDIPILTGDVIVKKGEEVTIEFRCSGDLTMITTSDGRRMSGHCLFYRNELEDFRVEEKQVSDFDYNFCKNSTQHRYSLNREEAEERLIWLQNRDSMYFYSRGVCRRYSMYFMDKKRGV